ncbi:SseB family protein [Lachnobacterium bovis]|uniref:SseB protein N-terminal domain-containing protein n=1 Tax=Lachnobacterium bovis TaxID=140626 RepID=A0A1H9THW9_9FIRM|nr:SseB family protein [Lachnobacterium bovis]SER96782.1 SseB protein N-terminal domain-containing protein [Lachnobacterium bovis]
MENKNKENQKIDVEMTIEIENKELGELIVAYNEHKDAEHLTKLVNHIMECRVLVPALMSEDKSPVPAFIQNSDDELYMPVYTSAKHIPEEPASPLVINMPFLAVVEMAVTPEFNVEGIILNAFTDSLIFKLPLLEKIVEVEKEKTQGVIPLDELTDEQYHVWTRKQVEFTLLPKKLFEEGDKFIQELSDGKEKYMDELYEEFYQEKRMYPYLEEEFSVMTMNISDDVSIVRVDFPERYMQVPSCYRVYLVWDRQKNEGKYFTIEKTVNEDIRLLGGVMPKISHASYGEAPDEGNELQTIIDLIEDKVIA